jgi:hypothetical protein
MPAAPAGAVRHHDTMRTLPATALGSLSLDLLAALIVVTVTAIGARLFQLLPSRRLWRLSGRRELIVCAAQSTSSETGKYIRPATGIGQLRALATIAPSLSRAYGALSEANIVLGAAPPGSYHEANIVSLGGSKNNRMTADILHSLREKGVPTPHSEASMLSWPPISTKRYEAETVDGEVVKDYGLVLRARSPYRDKRTVIVLAGASTFGTVAAARYFVERCAFTRGDFAAIVCADVRNAYVLVPTLVEMMGLTRRVTRG